MPATSRYPGESDEAFKARMMGSNPGAFGINVPQLPGGVQPGMLGGMGGPPAPQAPPMQDVMAQGPPQTPAPNDPFSMGPPSPPIDPKIAAGALLDDLTSVNMDTQAEKGYEDQLAEARALRDTQMPEGHMAGRVFVAPNALQYIGAGIKQYKGAKKEKAAEEELAKTRKEIGRKEGGITKEAAKEKGWGGIYDWMKKKDSGS